MEVEQENTVSVELFWTLFNEVLTKEKESNHYKFNPVGWCTDMAGAHFAGLCNVFSHDAKSKVANGTSKNRGIKEPGNLMKTAQLSLRICVTKCCTAKLAATTTRQRKKWMHLLVGRPPWWVGGTKEGDSYLEHSLDACQADVRDSVILSVEMKAHASGAKQLGTGSVILFWVLELFYVRWCTSSWKLTFACIRIWNNYVGHVTTE